MDPWDDLRRILHGGQQMATVQNGVKHCGKFQPAEYVHEGYRLQTDNRRICDSKFYQQMWKKEIPGNYTRYNVLHEVLSVLLVRYCIVIPSYIYM